MNPVRIALAALVASVLGGCVVLPVYKAAPGEEMVTIDVATLPSPAFCLDGVGYKAAKVDADTIAVPAGRRLSLFSNWYASDGYTAYYCTAGASYTLAPGNRFHATLEQNSTGCRVDLVRLDDSRPTGVALETSIGPALCNPWAAGRARAAARPSEIQQPTRSGAGKSHDKPD